MEKITYEMLRVGGACQDALDTFERVFGQEAEITEENVQKAIKCDLYSHSHFLANGLLNPEGYRKWLRADREVPHTYTDGVCAGCVNALRTFGELYKDPETRKVTE